MVEGKDSIHKKEKNNFLVLNQKIILISLKNQQFSHKIQYWEIGFALLYLYLKIKYSLKQIIFKFIVFGQSIIFKNSLLYHGINKNVMSIKGNLQNLYTQTCDKLPIVFLSLKIIVDKLLMAF